VKVVAAALLCGILALAAMAVWAGVVAAPEGGAPALTPFAPAFEGAAAGPAALMNLHDGQAFGSLALDPLLAHPERWGGGRKAMAYRATRPLLGWLVALTSFGSAGAAAWSLLAWTAVGVGLTAGAAAWLSVRWGRSPEWAPLLFLVPGVAGLVRYGGLSGGLAAGSALLGLGLWLDAGAGPGPSRRRRERLAVAALCVGALARESALVVPAALLWVAWRADRDGWRRLLWPFAVYAGWVVTVGLRLGVVPTDPGEGRLALPAAGLVAGLPQWTWVGWVCGVSVVALMAAAWWRAPAPEVRALVIVSAVFGLVLGEYVWRSWDFARALLPVCVVGACLLARPVATRPAPAARRPASASAAG